MNHNTKSIFLLAVIFMISSTACRANIARNNDGSFTVETSISQSELQDAISASISDPLIKNVTASLRTGYILVSGERQRLNDATKTDTLTFRLDLSASNGQLISSISNALIDRKPVEQNRVDNWNQTISNHLSKLGQKNPNSTLQAITVTTEMVTMSWNVKR